MHLVLYWFKWLLGFFWLLCLYWWDCNSLLKAGREHVASRLVVSPDFGVLASGDSRAVLCRGNKAIQVTDDHKPEREDEAVSALC